MSPHREKRGLPGSRKAKSAEPDFIMLLAEPEIQLLMRADGVDEEALLNMLKDVSVQLRGERGEAGPQHNETRVALKVDLRKYRRGVGIMLLNDRNEIFIAKRNDVAGEAWQMPQGGIDRGETPREAAFRELKEEIGTNNAEIIAESSNWFYYDLPEEVASKAWKGRWKGQRQKWFVMAFRGDETEINLATAHPEFDSWRWISIDALEALAVSFKKRLYVSLLGEFSSVFRD